ncbi:hypothetical protein EJ03DRAFT_153055 [Teratosphaeria nubilosa]|uniref:Uncharacterized protein n=1 Tax=Teratosphaeria nubilosa TaxID=161662 RepID=A0A6G1LJF3_9PEZI|nr:hypothetical protein EJ03DRAFT_153055 [Teratosphaeria nubilosa]
MLKFDGSGWILRRVERVEAVAGDQPMRSPDACLLAPGNHSQQRDQAVFHKREVFRKDVNARCSLTASRNLAAVDRQISPPPKNSLNGEPGPIPPLYPCRGGTWVRTQYIKIPEFESRQILYLLQTNQIYNHLDSSSQTALYPTLHVRKRPDPSILSSSPSPRATYKTSDRLLASRLPSSEQASKTNPLVRKPCLTLLCPNPFASTLRPRHRVSPSHSTPPI